VGALKWLLQKLLRSGASLMRHVARRQRSSHVGLSNGRREGNEWIARNPLRGDQRAGKLQGQFDKREMVGFSRSISEAGIS